MPKELTPDEEVAAAEAEAAEAQALIAALEQAVIDGDETITPEQLSAQEGLSRFARLRAEQTRKKAAKSKEAARQARLTSLRKEIEAEAHSAQNEIRSLVKTADEAISAIAVAAHSRNEKFREWRQRMIDLGVPAKGPDFLVPSKDHGNMAYSAGYGTSGIQVGTRLLDYHYSGLLIQGLISVIAQRLNPKGVTREYFFTDQPVSLTDEQLSKLISDLDDPGEKVSRDGHFYRGSGGALLRVDVPYTDEQVRNLGLKKLTAKEAFGE